MYSPTRYTTIVEPVLEVTLMCRADVAPWRQTLGREGITIPPEQNEIEIILSAAEMKYMGVKFQEFSISLRVDAPQAFLAYAFNSNRFFAWAERALFHTPYYFATIRVSSHHVQVIDGQQQLFEASLPDPAAVTHSAAERDALQVWLPSPAGQEGNKAYYFNALLEGDTRHYAITPDRPEFSIGIGLPAPLQPLSKSNLRIEGWSVRDHARHSKSRTVTTQR